MTLDDYLKRDDTPNLTELAEMVGVSKSRISQLRGEPDLAPEMALRLERATNGMLDASALSKIVADARAGERGKVA